MERQGRDPPPGGRHPLRSTLGRRRRGMV